MLSLLDMWHKILLEIAPSQWEWVQFAFMRTALLAILLLSPLLALLSTLVVQSSFAFFSDVVSHSALAGIALGVLLGFEDNPLYVLMFFSAALAVLFLLVRRAEGVKQRGSESSLSALMSIMLALGIVLLSARDFRKFTQYLIGDILAIQPAHIAVLLGLCFLVLAFFLMFANRFLLVSLDESLARSHGIRTFAIELIFAVCLALTIALGLNIVGSLVMSALLVLPALVARNVAGSLAGYTLSAVGIGVFAGVSGLFLSYYYNISTGASIVLVLAAMYFMALFWRVVQERS